MPFILHGDYSLLSPGSCFKVSIDDALFDSLLGVFGR